MKILTLIPARGGSKRVPGKNIRPLGQLPLIAWTIEAARRSGVCDIISVSTDDPDIAAASAAYGALVPGLRPRELATDDAKSIDVALHALKLHEDAHGAVDGLMLLQPTSPFRSAETIRRGVAAFAGGAMERPIVSVSPALSPPAWCFRIVEGDAMEPVLGWEALGRRSQDLEPTWVLDGVFYLASPEALRRDGGFLTRQTIPLRLDDPMEGIDIDTQEDWDRAAMAVEKGRRPC